MTLFAVSGTARAADDDPAVSALMANDRVSTFLRKFEGDEYSRQIESMTLRNGSCGFAGCSWSRLVSITVTHLVSNSPSTTIHALVSGTSPSVAPAKVEFVDLELKPMDESRWNWEAGR